MSSLERVLISGAALFVVAFFAASAQGQLRAYTAGPPITENQSSTSEKTKESNSKHADDFLVRGTVFTPEGLSFPDAEIRVRRSNEKKFRWTTYTNSRGEFAIRVKLGSEYEVVATAKGFDDQAKQIDAKSGDRIEEMSFRMERKGDRKR